MAENKKPRALVVTVGLLMFFLATTPMFFDIYRTAAFNTMARDDYAPYLLALVGDGGKIPGAPFAYRIVAVAVAVPFYYTFPVYRFSQLHNVDMAYLKASQALSLASYVWLVLTALVIHRIARKQYSATKASAAVLALLSFFLAGFLMRTGIDPFAVLVVSMLVLWLKDARVFVPLILVSVVTNEKIPIIFATMMVSRLIAARARRRRFGLHAQLLSSCIAVGGYFALVSFARVPGNEHQLTPSLFATQLYSTVVFSLSLKGLLLNACPMLVLLFIVVLAVRSRRQGAFQTSDISSLLVLLAVAMTAGIVDGNEGRIVMYTYPLYLPAASSFIDDALEVTRPPTADVSRDVPVGN